jgi:hypothetical protein
MGPAGGEAHRDAGIRGAAIYVATDRGCTTKDPRSASQWAKPNAVQPAPNHQFCASLKSSMEAKLLRAGFNVVVDRDKPHEFVAQLSAQQAVTGKKKGEGIFSSTSYSIFTKTQIELLRDDQRLATAEFQGESTTVANNYIENATTALMKELLQKLV